MQETIWEVGERKFDDVVKQLLYNRGIKGKNDIEEFLNPDFSKLHDPYKMHGIKEAVQRIKRASEGNEKVGIFADYDADGIPGAAFLAKVFREIGIKYKTYIPNREDGYGLSKKGIDYLISERCSLIVTVDLGIRNIEETKYCNEKNIDLIITDHHTLGEELPEADILINPKILKDKYPFRELSGGGVVFKLAQALGEEFPKIDERFLKWNLDLVAISTITDVVPLIDENRILAKFGLIVLSKTKNIGLQELYKAASIKQEAINTYVAGYQIGPRINAPGRVDNATKSYELLITDDRKEARELASYLNEKNNERQEEMEKLEKEAIAKVEKENLLENSIIVIAGKWVKGIIGPTASRIVERFHRPTIIFSEDKNAYCGSARSIEGVNLVEIITPLADILKKFGGHKGAAGITVGKEKFNNFLSKLYKLANKKIPSELLVKKLIAESELKLSELSVSLTENVKMLEPFGMGNKKPVFYSSGICLECKRFVGKDKKHLSFSIPNGGKRIKAIYFNCEKDSELDHIKYDILYNMDVNEWQGKKELNLNIIDIRANEKQV